MLRIKKYHGQPLRSMEKCDKLQELGRKGRRGVEYIKPRNLKRSEDLRTQTKRLGLFILVKLFKKVDFFKVTSAVVAAIFLWNQIVWAGDIAVSALDSLNDSQAQTFAPNYLQKQEAIHESVVDQKNMIEAFSVTQSPLTISGDIEPPKEETLDLKGPMVGASVEAATNTVSYIEPYGDGELPVIPSDGAILSVTTQEGDVIHYIGSAIDYIERADGSILRELLFGSEGELLGAEITYPDQTMLIIQNCALIEVHKPNGSIFYYGADGKVSSVLYPDQTTAIYEYLSDGMTKVTGSEKIAYYDAAGRLSRVEFNDLRVAVYDSGILVSVQDINGCVYNYGTADIQNGDATEYVVSLKAIVDSSATYLIENNNIIFVEFNGLRLSDFCLDTSGDVISGTLNYDDGSSVLIENGRIRKLNSEGKSIYYVYSGESAQQAINIAVSGDTVYLRAGIYHEHIVLSSGVNLVGEDSATTTIHGDYQERAHVIRALGNNRIEGLTISGSGPYASAPSSAVRIEGGNISIRNNRIVDNRDYALHIWAGDNILIEKNFFKDNHVGVQLPNAGTTIQYNTFVNSNIAINVLNGPATIIRNNIITGSTFQSIYEFSWAAYSAGQPASGYAIVEGNILYNNRERGGYYCKCLPPAVISQTLGNLVTNPLFANPASGDYSVPENSHAYEKGSLLPQALSDSLDTAAGTALKPEIDAISDTGIAGPVTLPGAMFDSQGQLITAYDFTDNPYFNIITYDAAHNIKEVRRPDGTSIAYMDGIPSVAGTNYDLSLSNPGNLPYPDIDQNEMIGLIAEYGFLAELGLLTVAYMTFEGDGGFTIINNWPSGNRRSDAYIGSGGQWYGTTLYYDEPSLKKYIVRLVNKDPYEIGNAVYMEYDVTGGLVRLDFEEPGLSIADYSDVYYPSADYAVANDVSTGNTVTFKRYGNYYWIDTLVSLDGTLRCWDYTAAGELAGHFRKDSDGTVRIYDDRNMLTKLIEPDSEFIKGSNLPWINYGYDLGALPGSGYHIGFSSDDQIGKLYEKLRSRRGDIVRLFLFCDLRSGVIFDASGVPLGFMDKVYDDMRALLAAARAFGVKLLPTLFDYGIADCVSSQNGYPVGEHPDLITDQAKMNLLLGIFDAFFTEFAADPSIYAWDIINEPEYAAAVQISQIRPFVGKFVDLIHAKSPTSLVTVGSRNRQDMAANWTGLGLDLYQFHYYDNAEIAFPLDYEASALGLDKPVIAGELEPTSITYKLDTLLSNKYAGGLFWEDDYYSIDDEERTLLNGWFTGIGIAYTYYSSGRKKTEILDDGTIRLFEDTATYLDGSGRLLREILAMGAYKLYSYYGATEELESVGFFMPDGSLFMQEEYGSGGELVSTTEYYVSGNVKAIRMADDTWFSYDESGVVLYRGERINGIDITYDHLSRIVRLKDMEYEEERRYVLVGDTVEYTLALHDNVVLAIKDGFYEGADLISRIIQPPEPPDMSVTYDNEITLGYTNERSRRVCEFL